jgi:Aspartyl/Asparaginyl beta-hydroxylase
MIAEKLPIKFDLDKLKDHFHTIVQNYPAVFPGPNISGWSMLSSTGDYTDGFLRMENCYYIDEHGKEQFDEKKAAKLNFSYPRHHIKPTQLVSGYIIDVLAELKQKFLVSRARWLVMKPGNKLAWHTDGSPTLYSVRLHIPLITNIDCFFETKKGKYHMEADGSCYLVAVNKLHTAYNNGADNRIHIVMNIVDEHGISENHKLGDQIAWW